jgi:hypothetical protein
MASLSETNRIEAYLVCLGLSWVSVAASLALNFGLAIFFALPPDFKRE